jgi:hypothetical protein
MERVVERNLETVSKFIEASRTFAIDFFSTKGQKFFFEEHQHPLSYVQHYI